MIRVGCWLRMKENLKVDKKKRIFDQIVKVKLKAWGSEYWAGLLIMMIIMQLKSLGECRE